MESASGESRKGRPELPFSLRAPSRSAQVAAADSDNGAFRLVTGNAGDHKLIHSLLRAANQRPSYEDFATWLDEPTYEPTDRLLVKAGSQIVAHVHVLHRLAWFGGVRMPVGAVQDLATLLEYRDRGCDRLLLKAAEQNMRSAGAIVAIARAGRPDVYRDSGWIDARDQQFTEANVNHILALLSSSHGETIRGNRSLRTRLWRHVELDGLDRVYRHLIRDAWGALDRSEPYWRWLVGRKAHNELIVAVHGKDEWADINDPAHIVGYAVTHGARVVELCVLPGYAKATARLLARACQDAIEQDHRSLTLLLPNDHPLHDVMLAAGGNWSTTGRAGGTVMLKLLDAPKWVELLSPVLLSRADSAGLALPLVLRFSIGRHAFQLEINRRGCQLCRESGGDADVKCSPEVFSALLLGNFNWSCEPPTRPMAPHDDKTASALAAIFPAVQFWQSQFDALRF